MYLWLKGIDINILILDFNSLTRTIDELDYDIDEINIEASDAAEITVKGTAEGYEGGLTFY